MVKRKKDKKTNNGQLSTARKLKTEQHEPKENEVINTGGKYISRNCWKRFSQGKGKEKKDKWQTMI